MKIFLSLILVISSIILNNCGGGLREGEGSGGGCTVEKNKDNSSTLKCDDGSSVVITNGSNGASCKANRFTSYRDPITNRDVNWGGTTITCPDSAPVMVLDGAQGKDGKDGKDGVPAANVFSCTISEPPPVEGSDQYVLFVCVDKNNKTQSFLVPRAKKI